MKGRKGVSEGSKRREKKPSSNVYPTFGDGVIIKGQCSQLALLTAFVSGEAATRRVGSIPIGATTDLQNPRETKAISHNCNLLWHCGPTWTY